jgi:hypothetical protein
MSQSNQHPNRAFPAVRIRKTQILINRHAMRLLSSSGSKFIALIVDADGVLYLKPLKLPDGTKTVARITTGDCTPRISAVRALAAENYPLGEYACTWEDEQLVVGSIPLEILDADESLLPED